MGENTTLRDNSHPCDKSVLDNESTNIMAYHDPQKLRKPAIKTKMKDKDIDPKSNSQANFLRGLDDGVWSTLQKDLYAKGVQIFRRYR